MSRPRRTPVTIDDQLTDVFDRGLRNGVESLSAAELELFRIQDFIIEFEMNGLSGYFYNRLPDRDDILATIAAMQSRGASELAAHLGEGLDLFSGYVESDSVTTWGDVLRRFDPTERLESIHRRISALNGYGLGGI